MRIEDVRRLQRRRLPEQGHGLGQDHQTDPQPDEPPQPARHRAAQRRRNRERDAETEREPREREPAPTGLQHDTRPTVARHPGRVASPTLKMKAPRAGCVSLPTASHSTR